MASLSAVICNGCYVMVNFEVASCSIFQDNHEKKFPDAEVSGGAGGMNAF